MPAEKLLTPTDLNTDEVLDNFARSKGIEDPPATAPESKSPLPVPPVPATPPTKSAAAPAPPKEEGDEPEVVAKEADPVTPPADPVEPAKPPTLDDIQLGAHARPQTVEQFTKVKEIARAAQTEAETARKELEQARRELEETKQKAAELPEGAKKELEELRAFRENLATEADPIFVSKFDQPIQKLDEEIYARLKQIGATDEHIAEIKRLGGVEKVDLDALVKDRSARRWVESKLLRKEELLEQRRTAAEGGPAKRSEWIAEQRKVKEAEQQKEASERTVEFDRLSKELEPFKPIPVPDNASAEEKDRIAKANTYISEQIARTRELATTNDPKTQAELAAGYALAHVFMAERDGLAKRLTETKKELETAQKQIEAFRKAGSTVRTDPRPSSTPKPPEKIVSADEALEAHFGGRK